MAWEEGVRNNSSVQDGRLKLNEVSGIFILGCNECSETIAVIPANEITALLNKKILDIPTIS